MPTRIAFVLHHESIEINSNLMGLGAILMMGCLKLTILNQEILDARQSFFLVSTNDTAMTNNLYRCDSFLFIENIDKDKAQSFSFSLKVCSPYEHPKISFIYIALVIS